MTLSGEEYGMYNLHIQFCIPVNLVSLSDTRSNTTHSKVQIGKNLSDAYSKQNSLK
jgi:hypothetical protein